MPVFVSKFPYPLYGQWLTASQFIINGTFDQGPLILTVGNNITRVAVDIFRQSFACGDSCYLAATGMPIPGLVNYHLILFGVGTVSNFPPIHLYHSESDKIEEVPFRQGGFFSPNGYWIVFYNTALNTQENLQNYQIWLRPVDPLGSTADLLVTTNADPFPLPWSPDSTKLAIPSLTGVTVFTVSNGLPIGTWTTDKYTGVELLWSPDSQHLVIRGNSGSSSNPEEALFLVHVP